MTNPVFPSLEQVWAWKRRAEEVTREMSPQELKEFYRREADEAERRLGVRLVGESASAGAAERKRQGPQARPKAQDTQSSVS